MKKDLKKAILGIEVIQFDGQKADLEELVNPKQLEKTISDWMPEVLSQEWIEDNTFVVTDEDGDDYAVVENRKLKDKLVPKQELPVIPKYVADWIVEYREKYDLYPALKRLEGNPFGWERIYTWYRTNTHEFVNAYLTGEYEVEEEPLYYALAKGHELTDGDKVYWVHDKNNDDMFIGILHSPSVYFLSEMSKSEWNELGINDSNADFVEVKEMEE